MKSVKTIITTLFIALGLTGCYTQLQYSQGVSRAEDEKYTEGYSWNGSSEESTEYYQDEDEGYVPFYYKDYEKANWWSSCHCNPYTGSSYYFNDPWYDHYSRSYYGYTGFHDPFYFSSRWRWRHFGLGFHHSFFAFDLYWGSPFYAYSGFLYGPYWAGYYYQPYRYGYGHYYGGYYDHDGSKSDIRSRTYRPRSIGTSRVANTSNRGDERNRSVTRQSSSTQARGIRSAGSNRTRGAVQQGNTRVQQPRTRGTSRIDNQSRSRSGSNERSRGTVQERPRSQSTSSGSIRSRGTQRLDRSTSRKSSTSLSSGAGIRIQSPRSTDRTKVDKSAIRSRISRQRVDQPKENTSDNRSSFFGRVGKIFNSSTPNNSIRIYRSRNNNSSVKSNNIFRQQTRTKSTTISRPRSTNRSSVTRSRSTSSSRSRGTSGSSRSSSSRSRGN